MSRTAAELDNCKGVLLPLPGLLPVPVEVHAREWLHDLGLRVGRAREPHGGGREKPRIKVASETVDEKLGVGGKTLGPSITTAVPSEERESTSLSKHSDPTDEVRLVRRDLKVGKQGGEVGNTLGNLQQIRLNLQSSTNDLM